MKTHTLTSEDFQSEYSAHMHRYCAQVYPITQVILLKFLHDHIVNFRQRQVRMYAHTYIHTYVRTYIHTYIHTYVHTYIRTYIHTYIHTYICRVRIILLQP